MAFLPRSSVQFRRSVMSDSLRPHELQHTRPPCPSPTPGVHSDSCPLSPWCHPAISSSVVPFFSCPQSLPASKSFPMNQLFAWGGQSTGVSAFNFVATVTIHSNFGAQESKICHCFHFFPFYLLWSGGTGCHDLSFLMLCVKPAFSLYTFTVIKRLFSYSLLFAIRLAYLKLWIFLLAILNPSSSSFIHPSI